MDLVSIKGSDVANMDGRQAFVMTHGGVDGIEGRLIVMLLPTTNADDEHALEWHCVHRNSLKLCQAARKEHNCGDCLVCQNC